jgi:hypothetical protein
MISSFPKPRTDSRRPKMPEVVPAPPRSAWGQRFLLVVWGSLAIFACVAVWVLAASRSADREATALARVDRGHAPRAALDAGLPKAR